jgi:hypothetical protein
MRWWLAVTVVLSIGWLAVEAGAQSASEPGRTDLQTELKRRRFVVHPRPDVQVVTQDVGRAVVEMEAEQRRDALVREGVRPGQRRPDLDPAVSSGIQQRNLLRALPPR